MGIDHLTTSTLASASTSEPFEASTMPICPTTTATTTTIGFIVVAREFLHNLVERQDATTVHLTNMESKLASLYGQI